jgi:ubiquinone/menaquinone biosynthesis C-methylase UbiE
MTIPPQNPDPEAVEKFAEKVWRNIGGGLTSALCFLGDQLGLYRTLAETGPITSEELAAHTGLHERWLREWLHQQACVGMIAYGGNGRFHLTPEAIVVLADEDHLAFAGGGLTAVIALTEIAPKLQDSFQTGVGLPYDALGINGTLAMERMGNPWFRQQLVQEGLPELDGVVAKLEAGAMVADVGCGSGLSTIIMAQAFPQSQFHGYDTSQHALNRALHRAEELGVTNVHWHNPDEEPLPDDGRYDLITTFDVVHDTTDPAGLIAAISRAIKADGTWYLSDINSKPTFEENLADNPAAGLTYAYSVLLCMSAGLSEPNGVGMGTLGFHEEMARQMTAEAGFSRFKKLKMEDPTNSYYEVRP